MSKSLEDLKSAFAGESQANRKYLAFANKAEKDGFSEVARLFRVAAEGETIHAHKHLEAMNGVGETTENLKAAIEGETFEFTEMYPGMIEDAKAESNEAALKSFSNADAVEKEHAELYQRALENPSEFVLGEAWICSNCGHIHFGSDAPAICSVCSHPTSFFSKVS